MFAIQPGLATFLLLVAGAVPGERHWVDSTGNYSTEATLVDFDSSNVVLRKTSGQLIALPIARLSSVDQMYLRSDSALAAVQQYVNPSRSWTLRNGMRLVGTVVDYDRGRINIQRSLGRILINDTPYQRLSKLQQFTVRLLISERDNANIRNYAALEDWVIKQRGVPRDLDWQGVLLDLQDGGTVSFPLVLFSGSDVELLQRGWDQWAATRGTVEMASPLAQESPTLFPPSRSGFTVASAAPTQPVWGEKIFNMQQAFNSGTQQYQQESLQLQQASLGVQAWAGGLFDLWQVQLFPKSGSGAFTAVIIPARNSNDAVVQAIQRYPDYLVGALARVSRLGGQHTVYN